MINKQETQTPLKTRLLKKIESEHVCPRSKLFFQSRECLVWFLWALSIVFGAFSVAVTSFVVIHHQYALYEATHENFFTFIVDVLPYLWIIIFALMVYVAFYNVRHTKCGYKFSVYQVVISSVMLSIVFGFILQLFGVGYSVDKLLGDHMAMYISQEKLERKLWQAPNDGRLLGRQIFSTLSPTTTIIFEDSGGNRWRMSVNELRDEDIVLLSSQKKVRILGKKMNGDMMHFHACGAFPYIFDKSATMKDMDTEREVFLDWVYKHSHHVKDRTSLLEGETFASTSLSMNTACSNISAVKRVPLSIE